MIYIVFVCNRVIRIITCADVKPHGRFFLLEIKKILRGESPPVRAFFLLKINCQGV